MTEPTDRIQANLPPLELEHLFQRIAQLGESGKLSEAASLGQQVVQQYPQVAKVWDFMGLIALQQGQLQEAVGYAKRAIDLDPGCAEFYDHAGVIACRLGEYESGVMAYRQALDRNPTSVQIRYNLGLALAKLGRLPEAIDTFLGLVAHAPSALAHYQLGNLYQQQQDFSTAIDHYQRAIDLQPQHAEAWYNLGVTVQQQGDLHRALQAYQQALQYKPQYVQAINALGTVLELQQQIPAALECYRQALTLQSDYLPALMNLGNGQIRLEQLADADATFRRLLRLDSQYLPALDTLIKVQLRQGDWQDLPEQTARLRAIAQTCFDQQLPCDISPFNSLFLPFSAAQQQAIAHTRAQKVRQKVGDRLYYPLWVAQADAPLKQTASSKIRLGYVSGDFRYHAMGHLLLQLFAGHDRQSFEVYAYSLGPDDGSVERQKFMADCDCFRDLQSLTPAASAAQVYQDQIDILIDLAGYTDYARPEMFALRPAPLQINYLGYPATLGAEYVDYIITDSIVTPPNLAAYFTEQCFYLPDSYQLNSYQPFPVPASQRPSASSPFIFCCFNKCEKIEPQVFAVWMRILAQVPDSVLWLLSDRPQTEANLKKAAAMQGIEGDRLVFVPRVTKEEHLARHAQTHLFLDTLYYNAHVTASDALWSGTPLITHLGNTFASRVAASLLTAAGLPELITHSLEEYEHLAVHLATHPQELQRLKARLTTHPLELPLFNTQRTIRHLETGYQLIWQRYQTRHQPAPLWVSHPQSVPDVGNVEGKNTLHQQNRSRQSNRGEQALSQKAASNPAAPAAPAPASSVPLPSVPPPLATDILTCTADDGFCQWLSQAGGSLFLSTYQAGKVIGIGWNGQQVTVLPRQFTKPMGVAVMGDRLAVATEAEVILFANAPLLAPHYPGTAPGQYDALLLPRTTYLTGNLQIHDLAYGEAGLWMVNTRFSCLAQLSPEFNFIPCWQPAFISQLAPEDRCHLNGLALVNGTPKYVTALGISDTPRGWSLNRATGGVVLDVETQEVVLQGLSMPHSPRWHQEKLWLLNSGAGELWQVDPQTGEHQVVCTLPGFGRGLALVGHYALVGLSQIRERHLFSGLPLQERFDRLQCGVAVVDLHRGEAVGWLEFSGGCQELYEVVFLPHYLRPLLLNGTQPTLHQAIVTPDFSYWVGGS